MGTQKSYYRRHLPHYQPEGATYFVTFRLAGSLPKSVIEELRRVPENCALEATSITNIEERKIRLRKIQDGYFKRFDSLLNEENSGPQWLRQPEITSIVKEAIHFRDGKEYDLYAYCIMPNHVHMVFSLQRDFVGRFVESTIMKMGPAIDLSYPKGSADHKVKSGDVQRTGRDSVTSYGVTGIIGSLKKFTALRANKILGRSGAFWQDESYDHVVRDNDELEKTIWYVINNPVVACLVDCWEQWPWTYCAKRILKEI
ncbi:MAG: transposase [bacterium]